MSRAEGAKIQTTQEHNKKVAEQTGTINGGNFNLRKVLDRDTLKPLFAKNPTLLWSLIGLDAMIIFTTVVVSELYWHPLLYLFAVMAIGARQLGLGSIALHDGAHRLISKDVKFNDRVAKWLGMSVFVFLLENLETYRKHHMTHHRYVNDLQDPDKGVFDYFYQVPRLKALWMFVPALSGFMFLYLTYSYLRRQFISSPLRAVVIILFILALVYGTYSGVFLAELFVLYWLIPFATWGMFANEIRSYCEHYPQGVFGRDESVPRVFHTRDVKNSLFDSWFLVTRGVNYHLSHHLFPQVPFYHLKKLQIALERTDAYKQFGHVTYGYHSFLTEFFFRRTQEVGKVKSNSSPSKSTA